MFSRNPHLLSAGYAPAADIARTLCKSLSTVHRMVEDGRAEGVRDGRALYVKLDTLIARFRDEGNTPLMQQLVKLKKDFAIEARTKLAGGV